MKGTLMSNWIGILELFLTAFVGILAIVTPLYLHGKALRDKYLKERVDKLEEVLHGRIDECEGDHVHKEFCHERSGHKVDKGTRIHP